MRASLHAVKGQQVNGEINNGKLPDNRVVDLGLPGDQMFQRWLLDRVHQRHEMIFERLPPLPPLTGFLTGFDETSYAISTTSEFPPRSHVIPRATVTGVVESQRSLHEMEERVQVLIKRYTARIHRACEEELIPSRRMAATAQVSERPRQNLI